jgi:hypothetical protein
MEVDGYAHAVKGVLAVVTADEEERFGVKALGENLWEGFADPLQARLVGGVIEGKYENGLSARRRLGKGHGREQKQDREKSRKPVQVQGFTIIAIGREHCLQLGSVGGSGDLNLPDDGVGGLAGIIGGGDGASDD